MPGWVNRWTVGIALLLVLGIVAVQWGGHLKDRLLRLQQVEQVKENKDVQAEGAKARQDVAELARQKAQAVARADAASQEARRLQERVAQLEGQRRILPAPTSLKEVHDALQTLGYRR